VGEVIELRGKRAVVKIGMLPMQVDLAGLVVVKEKITDPPAEKK
jgi:DNA mismatch repair protein MutS2